MKPSVYDALLAQNKKLKEVLQRYVNAYPAFRMKPCGAPGSSARIEQDNLMGLEDAARAALASRQEPDRG